MSSDDIDWLFHGPWCNVPEVGHRRGKAAVFRSYERFNTRTDPNATPPTSREGCVMDYRGLGDAFDAVEQTLGLDLSA